MEGRLWGGGGGDGGKLGGRSAVEGQCRGPFGGACTVFGFLGACVSAALPMPYSCPRAVPPPQGFLYKRTTAAVSAWKRRFFVLDSQGLLYYYSQKVWERGRCGSGMTAGGRAATASGGLPPVS